MSTDALELALALHQAPIQRFALRDRPLPSNMGEVLQLASAMQPQLEAAAARFSESEETIVEAVRFYLHQVLFESGTDAYRILGLAANADIKRIRQHHIWLQRWLHPDRRGEDWEAVLATKINWAWQQLRNESSRVEYDRSRQRRVVEDAAAPASVERVQVPAWNAEPVEPARYWLRRVVMGSLLTLCVVLFYLAATRQDRVDPEALASHSHDADSEIRARLPFVDDSSQRTQQPVSNPDTATPAPNLVDSAPLQISADPQSEQPARSAPVAASPDPTRVTPEPLAEIAVKPAAVLPLKAAGHSSTKPPAPTESRTVMNATDAKSVRLTPDRTEVSPTPPRQRPRAAKSAAITSKSESARVTELTRVTPVEAIPPKKADTGRALAQREASAKTGNDPIAVAATARHIEPSIVKSPPPVEPRVSVEQPGLAHEIGQVGLEPANIERLADSAPAITLAPESAKPVQSAPPTPADLDRATLERFELARARVRSMVGYFRSADIIPPNWNDESGRHSVVREREVLQKRSGELGIDRFVLDPPDWQISHSAVSLKATYHIDAKRTSAESGRFQLDMVWHDDNWKITRIELSPGS